VSVLKRYWLAIAFTAAGFVVAGFCYGHLPPRIPVHFNLQGVADGWMPKREGAFAIPLISLLLLAALIAAGPKAARESSTGSLHKLYPTIVATIAGFCLYQTILLLAVGAGVDLDPLASAGIGFGFVIMFVGNSFGKVTRNSLVGIRTPWALRNEEVWGRTQRVGAWLFVLAGLASVIAGVLGFSVIVGVAVTLAAAATSVIYSYVIWRRIDRHGHSAH